MTTLVVLHTNDHTAKAVTTNQNINLMSIAKSTDRYILNTPFG